VRDASREYAEAFELLALLELGREGAPVLFGAIPIGDIHGNPLDQLAAVVRIIYPSGVHEDRHRLPVPVRHGELAVVDLSFKGKLLEEKSDLLRRSGEIGNGLPSEVVGVVVSKHGGESLIGGIDGSVEVGLEDTGQVSFEEEAVSFHAPQKRCVSLLPVIVFSTLGERATPARGGDDREQDDADDEGVSPQMLVAQLKGLELVVIAQQVDFSLPLPRLERGLELGELAPDLGFESRLIGPREVGEDLPPELDVVGGVVLGREPAKPGEAILSRGG